MENFRIPANGSVRPAMTAGRSLRPEFNPHGVTRRLRHRRKTDRWNPRGTLGPPPVSPTHDRNLHPADGETKIVAEPRQPRDIHILRNRREAAVRLRRKCSFSIADQKMGTVGCNGPSTGRRLILQWLKAARGTRTTRARLKQAATRGHQNGVVPPGHSRPARIETETLAENRQRASIKNFLNAILSCRP